MPPATKQAEKGKKQNAEDEEYSYTGESSESEEDDSKSKSEETPTVVEKAKTPTATAAPPEGEAKSSSSYLGAAARVEALRQSLEALHAKRVQVEKEKRLLKDEAELQQQPVNEQIALQLALESSSSPQRRKSAEKHSRWKKAPKKSRRSQPPLGRAKKRKGLSRSRSPLQKGARPKSAASVAVPAVGLTGTMAAQAWHKVEADHEEWAARLDQEWEDRLNREE